MGVYLSSPITEKESIDGQCERFVYGASSMQGWRITQEDAHNCIPVFDEKTNTSFFAVYDGHGGSEVAKYCERHFPDFINNLMKVQGGAGDDPTRFIKHAFLAFDATLTNEDVIKELKQLAGKDENKKNDNGHTESGLRKEEARAPLDRLLAKYKSSTTRDIKNVHKKESFQSPALKSKSGSASDTDSSSQHAENGLSSSNLSSLLSPSSCKQDSSSEVSNGVSEGDNSNRSEYQDSVNINSSNNEGSVNNNNNIDKLANPPDVQNLCSTSTDQVVLPSDNNKTKVTVSGDQCNSTDGEVHPVGSNASLSPYSCQQDESAGGIVSSTNSADVPSNCESGTNAAAKLTKAKATDNTDIVDGATDTSDDDEEEADDDDDLWEDMSDEEEEEEEEDGPDNDVPMMDMSNEEPGSDSGCTACVVLMQDKKLVVANAGDSRCVLSRAGKAIELSFDHKPEDECEKKRIEKAGGKVTADGRVNGGLNLSRAIGDHVYKRNRDLPAKEQMITALPDIESTELRDEDQFIVIACDGIWNYMSSQEVVDYVLEKLKDPDNRQNPSQICEQLFDHCLAPNTFGDGTGCDNMTCIIILLDAFVKSKAQQTTQAADTKGALDESEDDSSEQPLPNLSEKENVGSGNLKRCANSVEVPEGKRLKVEEEVA